MTTEELADFIFQHRKEALACGEGGIVNPVELDVRGSLMLEEWSRDQAKELKTKEAYLARQAKAREKLKAQVQEVKVQEARAGIAQGLEIQANFEAADRIKKLLN